MPRVRVVCQHHPRRGVFIPRLVEAVRPFKLWVVADADTGGPARPWDTYKRCLLHAADEYLVILQDDALPAAGFAKAVRRIIGQRPGRIICLYHGHHPLHSRQQCERACERGDPYAEITPTQWLPLVGVVWPVALARQAAQEIGDPAIGYADDGLIARWMHRHQLEAVATVPSIVQHDDETPTLMRLTDVLSNRSAWCFTPDAGTVRW